MSALNQYLDLYRENAAAIDGASADVINALRPAALDILKDGRLPDRSVEGYEKTSIDEMFAPDYGVNVTGVNIPVDVAASFRCDVPAMSTLMGFVLNDSFMPVKSLQTKLPEGVIFTSLREAAIKYPDLVSRYYGRLAPLDNPAVALNSLLLRDGVFVYVPRGVKMEKPLQLVNIFSAPTPMMGIRRIVVALEEDASASLLVCDHTQDSTTGYLASQVMEVDLARGASLRVCHIEESSAETSRHALNFFHQEEGSRLAVTSATLTCGSTRNEYNVLLDGEHAETFLAGMAIGTGKMHIDNDSEVIHRACRCRSNQLFKYVLDDESDGAFEGSILVSPGARFTEAYQSDRNLLASTLAKMHCKPQLEIYNDDVKCSHGAATGQLDNEALFYMRTRGIPEAEARTMLMQAFLLDVVETVEIPGVADRLRHLVEHRFAACDQSACETCRKS